MTPRRRPPHIGGLAVIGSAVGGILIAGGKAGSTQQVLVIALAVFFLLGVIWLAATIDRSDKNDKKEEKGEHTTT